MLNLLEDFSDIVEVLWQEQARYAVVGGLAVVIYGSLRITQDLDCLMAGLPRHFEIIEAAVRQPWRERLAQLPPDAVPVAGPAADIPAVPVVADSAGEYDAGSADASRSSQGRTDKALSQRRSGDRCGR